MNGIPIPKDHRAIVRYCYGIAAIAAASAAILITSAFIRHQAELRDRDRLERFHVRSLMLAVDVHAHTSSFKSYFDIRRGIEKDAQGARPETTGANRQLSVALQSIEQSIDALVLLQTQHGEPAFAQPTARARSRLDRLRKWVNDAEAPPSEAEASLESFQVAVRQLHQLHSVTLEDSLVTMTAEEKREAWLLAGFATTVLVVTAVIVTRLLRRIRERLQKNLETESALRERDRQLLHSQKIQALGTLVGGVAHDFNNILTAVLGHAEMLQSDLEAGQPGAASAGEILKAGERAASLTRQMLAFSRYEPSHSTLVDLNESVLDLQPMISRLIREDVSLDFSLGQDVGMTRVDHAQVEQILMNLITNACHAMPHGGSLSIKTHGIELSPEEARDLDLAPGGYSLIRVEDTGAGMTSEIRSRALEPFFTTKARGEGTGLGLSTVHGIVTGSEGRVLVESTLGQGTRVDVYLPRLDRTPADADETQERPGSLTGSETLLLVEDDEQVRGLTAAGLIEHGYEVLACAHGSEALRLCREHPEPIHLILTDVVLPNLSGPDIVTQARELRPSIAAILMSGYTDPSLLEKIQASSDPLLPKPFKLQELLRLVRQQLASLLEQQSAGY